MRRNRTWPPDGMHTEFCAVCNSKLEYRTIDAGHLGDTDFATCEECDATYTEGYINAPGNVYRMQQAYLQQAVTTKACEAFIKRQLNK